MLRRAWAAPIAAHLAALCLVLVGGAMFVGTHWSLSEDEGAAIVQARQLSEHHAWIRPHPYPQLDPEGRMYPYELSEHGTKGFAPYAKHPLYTFLLGGLWRVGQINALVGFSILGTVVAAAVASRFGRRVDAALERPALWAVGLGSPLLFDSYLVIAHAVGAALAGLLVLLITRRKARHPFVAIGAAATLAVALVLLRTEGILFVGATAAVAFLSRRSRWLGVATGGAGFVAYLAEDRWTAHILGTPLPLRLTAAELAQEQNRALGGGGLSGRIEGAWTTLLRPGYGTSDGGEVLLLALVLFAAAVVLGRINRQVATVCAVLAAACAVSQVIGPVQSVNLVPGLFVAAPIVWVGLWAGLSALEHKTLRLDGRLVAIVGLFSLGVLATQYTRGGGVEWGGRFFALALPVGVPLAVAALRTQPVALVRCVLVAAAAMSVLSVREMRHIHRNTQHIFTALEVPADAIPVTTAGLVPRLDWRRYDDRKWLLVRYGEMKETLDRMQAHGVGRVLVLYPSGQRPLDLPGPSHRVGQTRWRTIDIELD